MKLVPKLTVSLLLGIGVVFGIDTYLSIRRFAQFYDADALRDLRVIGRTLSLEVEKSWPRGGQADAERLVRVADIRDPDLRISWRSLDPRHASRLSPELAELLVDEDGDGQSLVRVETTADGGELLHTYVPVRASGRLVGAIEVSEYAHAKKRFLRARILQRASAAMAMVLLCGVLAWIAGSRLVGVPVGQLMEQARRIGAGDFSTRLRVTAKDEIGALSRSMNAMATELERSRAALEAQTVARVAAIEQLRHVDRLKTVGTLASGVAHELGTPLSVISGRAQMVLSEEATRPEEIAESARVIRSQADRMARIVRELLDFARRRSPEKAPFDLRQLTGEAISILHSLATRRGVRLALLEPDAPPLPAVVDGAQIQQAVTNLLMNALQATQEGGTVEVQVTRELRARPGPRPGEPQHPCLCIAVRDEGAGISEEHLAQLFDPFFTTKDVGEGTGLGLSVAHGIAAEHGGWIDVQTKCGHGSLFRLCLPAEPGA